MIGGVFGVILVSACSSTPSDPAATERRLRGAEPNTGEQVYRLRCAACHGAAGEGNLGPALVGISRRMSPGEQLEIVARGRGTMPSFGAVLSNAAMRTVVDYSRRRFG
jgi:mono/diheme cytochrome c family protein